MPETSTTSPTPAPPPAHQSRRQPNQRPSGNWITADGANIFYRPRNDAASRPPATPVRFPAPLIGPRRTRPHAIHILTFPPGYVPRELRQKTPRRLKEKRSERKSRCKSKSRSSRGRLGIGAGLAGESGRSKGTTNSAGGVRKEPASSSIRPRLGKLLSSFSNLERPLSFVQPQQLDRQRTPSPQVPAEASPLAPIAVEGGGSESSGTAAAGPAPGTDTLTDSLTAAATGVPTPTPILPEADDVIAHEATQACPHPRPHCHHHRDDRGVLDHIRHPHTAAQHHGQQSQHSQQSQHRRRHTLSLQTLPSQQPSSLTPQQHLNHHTEHDRERLQRHRDGPTTVAASPAPTAAMAAQIAPSPSAYNLAGAPGNRNGLMSVRTAKSAVSSLVTEVPKPVATGSGVACSIILAEPNIFLSGFDHDGHARRQGQGGTALLRGKLQLSVSKNVKIKAVQLKLLGRARTEWPEGIPPLKQDVFEEEGLRTQVLTFFNAMNEGWETDYGNQCTYQLKNSSANSSSTNLPASRSAAALGPPLPGSGSSRNLNAKDFKRLSMQNAQSRSFGKGENPAAAPTQAKGFKVFYPGTYDYSFELPIDHHQLETTKLQYGSVKWELHATVDRAGAFKPNLHGMKEVSIVRLPDQLSLEMSEPISINRRWEDQLHYDIIISGKSFPIGSKIPIAFKLTPLAKVQVHKLKVFVTESVEYWTNDKRVTRKDPGRKILLLEKSAGKPLDPAWASSEMRTVRGGELTPQRRREARDMANRRRQLDASTRQSDPEPLPEPSENLLGDLDLGLESMWGSTELEANVQLPTCEMMAKNKDLRLNPDCSWKNVNVYHWIKIVMRISRLDPDDPSGTKRRHFEISIDSPFTVLNCRATQANTNLPAYAGPPSQPAPYQSTCGCPDAASVATGQSPNSSTGTLPNLEVAADGLPAPPQAAHLSESSMNPASSAQNPGPADPPGVPSGARPIHLMRVPSFNPPGFDEDSAPPPAPELVAENPEAASAPVATPPPLYDVVVGTPSVDGMADYFARLAEHGYEGEDSGSDSDETPPRILERSGRVNVSHPRTPGGRMPSRSLEFSRPPVNLSLASLPNRANAAGTAV